MLNMINTTDMEEIELYIEIVRVKPQVKVLENEKGIYVFAHITSCDVSNNLDAEKPDESSPVHYHLPPSPQFEYVQNFGNAIYSPWVQHTTGYSSE